MPGNDIFGYARNAKARGVFSQENSKLTFGDVDDPVGYLVQNWNVTYQQQVTELFEIGSSRLFWAKGRPQGQGTIGRVIGDQDVSSEGGFFPDDAYDICDGGAELILTATGGHCEEKGKWTDVVLDKGVRIVMDGCVVSSIGYSMQVSDVRLMENFGWRFGFMEIQRGS